MRNCLAFILTCFASLGIGSAASAADPKPEELVQASLLADVDAITGPAFTLGIHLKMKPHWHTYWVNPGESGEATKIKITGPRGFEFGPVQWPLPKAIESFGAITYGYEDEVMLLVPVKVGKAELAKGKATIEVHVGWLSCNDTCIEGEAKLSITLPTASIAAPSAHAKSFDAWRAKVPRAMTAAEAAVLAKAEQAGNHPAIALQWKDEVKKVEWFPIATPAVAIENVTVKHDGKATRIAFKPTVYKPDRVPDGHVESVVVFEDAKGVRQGIVVPFKVETEK
jgi:thiol:disulfide interchange protein DsbD